MDNKSSINISIFIIFFSICSLPIHLENLFCQSAYPKLFLKSDDVCLIVWNGIKENYSGPLARFVSKTGNVVGESFPIYSNELISFNLTGEFIVTNTINHPGNEYFPDSFTIKARIYHSISDITNVFTITHQEWPFCGTGFLGFEELLLRLKSDFLYIYQFNGYLNTHRYNNTNELIAMNHGTSNAIYLTSAILTDDSYLVVWFNGRYDGYIYNLPYGIYATLIEKNMISIDSILIKQYTYPSECVYDLNSSMIPRLKITALNDSTYQLFTVDLDSLYLSSYLLDRRGEIKDKQKIEIPKIHEYSGDIYIYNDILNVSNFNNNTRTLFLSINFQGNERRLRTSYLFYFDKQGLLLGETIIDTTKLFRPDNYQFKVGKETFLNPFEKEGTIYIGKYNNFTLIDSTEIGTVSSITTNFREASFGFNLFQNYPNPFNSRTKIKFIIENSGPVDLSIFNSVGQKIKTLSNKSMNSGLYEFGINMDENSSGVYFYRLISNNKILIRKMLLIK